MGLALKRQSRGPVTPSLSCSRSIDRRLAVSSGVSWEATADNHANFSFLQSTKLERMVSLLGLGHELLVARQHGIDPDDQ